MDIGVIIPTHNRSGRLRSLLAALLADSGLAEVIVVVDGPDPRATEVLEQISVVDNRVRPVIKERNEGLALARITGLKVATTEVVLMLDDDVHPEPNLASKHLKMHEGLDSTVVVIGYMPTTAPRVRKSVDVTTWIYRKDYQRATARWASEGGVPLDNLWNGNVSLRRDLYVRAEAFRPSINIAYHEDLDLGLRLKALGAVGIFAPTLVAEHMHERGIKAYADEAIRRGSSVRELEKRWPVGLDRARAEITGDHSPVLLRLFLCFLYLGFLRQRALILLLWLTELTGFLHSWKAQEGLARLLRRHALRIGYYQDRGNSGN